VSKLIYCYTCNVQHPKEEMRQIMTKKRTRWRCIKTIVAARLSRDKRQEFAARMKAKDSANAQTKRLRIRCRNGARFRFLTNQSELLLGWANRFNGWGNELPHINTRTANALKGIAYG
jgi:hypothetical protein